MKKIAVLLLLATAALTNCTTNQPNNPGVANPASVNCVEKGGTLEIRDTAAGQEGICKFPDGSSCEEWAFFRGECQAGQNK